MRKAHNFYFNMQSAWRKAYSILKRVDVCMDSSTQPWYHIQHPPVGLGQHVFSHLCFFMPTGRRVDTKLRAVAGALQPERPKTQILKGC